MKVIKEKNADNGAFSNVVFSKANWINGYIGISGFNIVCVANFDSARVEMYLGKSDKTENKKPMIHLLSIELKSRLLWAAPWLGNAARI